jgi:MFS family permease
VAHDLHATTNSGARRPAVGTADGWVRGCAAVALAVWFNFLAFGAVIPVIPRLATEMHRGPAPAVVGVAFATTSVVALVLRPIGGRLAQRRGARRVVAAGSVVAMSAGAAYLLPLGVTGLMAARVATGVAEALVMTAGAVWVVSLAPDGRRGQVIGWYGLSMWGGLAGGPLLGEVAFGLGAFAGTWVVAALLPGIALLVLVSGLTAAPIQSIDEADVSRQLLPRAAVLPGLALGAGGFGYACVTSFGVLAMSEREVSGGSVLLSLFSAAYVAVRVVGGWLPDQFGAVRVICVAGTAEAIGLALIAGGSQLWVTAVGALAAGGGFSLLYPSLAVIAVDVAPEAERGATLGALSSFLDLSMVTAGLVGGIVAGASYPAVFGLAAVLAMTCGVLAKGSRRSQLAR